DHKSPPLYSGNKVGNWTVGAVMRKAALDTGAYLIPFPEGLASLEFNLDYRLYRRELLCLAVGNLTHFVAGNGQTQWFSHKSAQQRRRWGGRRDLNPRQPDPQSGALTRLSYDHQ